MSYGTSTWNDFIEAYQKRMLVYCRASSNSNPATGSQTRMAFMAYVNNAENPTEVEFQYYRSVNQHSITQQGDQIYVYKLTSSGTWSVTTREASSKVVAGTNMTSSYSNGAITLNTDLSGYATETYVDNAIGDISTSSLFILDPNDYTARTIELEGLKKGIYIWNDFDEVFRFKLNSSYSTTFQVKSIDKMVYILEDITSSTPNNTKIIYVPNEKSSVIHPDYYYHVYAILNTSSSTGVTGINMGYTSYVMANNSIAQTIDGIKTFNSLPVSDNTPTSNTQLVNKQYVDSAIASAITDALGGSY